ncbi:MAG: hypothetical protein WBE83_02795 [Candidatus Cybelea sp.]
MIAFYIGEGRIASLGDYPVFAASCTIGLTIVTLAFVWYLQGHMREFDSESPLQLSANPSAT